MEFVAYDKANKRFVDLKYFQRAAQSSLARLKVEEIEISHARSRTECNATIKQPICLRFNF